MADGKDTISLGEDETFSHDAEGYIPFVSANARVAKLEGVVRTVACMALRGLFKRFDFKFADGYDINRWERGLKDVGLWTKGDLWATVTPREESIQEGDQQTHA